MKKIFLFSFLSILSLSVHSQEKNWTKYEIGDFGSILIPNTLALRDSSSIQSKLSSDLFLQKTKSAKIEIDEDASTMIFQPKEDLNFNSKSFGKYSRIIIAYKKKKNGFYKFNFKYRQDELKIINDAFYDKSISEISALNNVSSNKFKLIEWFKLSQGTINNSSYLKYSFIRKMDYFPEVMVVQYCFFNKDISLNITVSYRISEKKLWYSDLETSISSFKFNKLL